MVEIKEISKKKDLKKFICFPDKLYKGEKNFVPELKSDEYSMLVPEKNFAFEYCDAKFFLAYRDGRIVGRVGAIVNRKANALWDQKNIRVTRIDFIDDLEVSGALFGAVEAWAKELGLTEVHGPLGFSDIDKEGLLVEGFDRMSTAVTIYNYPYYPKHFEAHGYVKDVDWIEYRITAPEKGDQRVARIQELAKKVMERTNVHFYNIKKIKDAAPIIIQFFDLLNVCYKDLYGTVPFTDKIAKDYLKRFTPLLNPDYAKFIVDDNDKLVGFGLAAPSLAQAFKKSGGRLFPFGWIYILNAVKKPEELELYLVAVHPDYQKSGLAALLLNEITASAVKNGIKYAESTSELEHNKKIQDFWKNYDAEQHKRRRCYKKMLTV
ncbi:MAG: GNAT family N-acetyltransferase [Eubacteriales bacterium]|nr:GNAT family N-acetyltransferase [Eubacteriales bacterium]